MHIVSFDHTETRARLFPLTWTRPVGNLRVGILTIAEKWAKWLQTDYSFLTVDYLREKFPYVVQADTTTVCLINGGVCPDERLCEAVSALEIGSALWSGSLLLALKVTAGDMPDIPWDNLTGFKPVYFGDSVTNITRYEDIFTENGTQIALDFDLLTRGRTSASLSGTNIFLGDRIFAEEGAVAECSTFNSIRGPIYLGRDSEVWEGSHIRGSFALGHGAQVKMGTRVYSNVSVGPNSRVAGELNTCVVWGNSYKGHEGYLGSSVIGEWCNWGADTNNSNLKNNYGPVRVYDYETSNYRDTGLVFCGIVMGDHSKCGINTAFNTGTVVGVGANIFGVAQPPKFVPDFAWAEGPTLSVHRFDKMVETAKAVFRQRQMQFNTIEENLLENVFERSVSHRDKNF